MSRIFRLSLPLIGILLLSALGAGVAGAQAPAGDQFPSLTLAYRDRDGAGSIHVTNVGADPASGGDRLAVSLQQNGRDFQGHGFARQLDRASYLVSFWLTDGSDTAYVFTGVFVRGFAGWTGEGRYELVGNPSAGDRWSAASAPCPVC